MHKHTYFLLFFFFISHAQSNKIIDSLKIEINKTKNDTLVIEHYSTIANEYIYIDKLKFLNSINLIYSKSKKLNYKKGLANYFYLKAKMFYVSGDFKKAKLYLIKGKKITPKKLTLNYLEISCVESSIYLALTQYDKSIFVAKNALKQIPKEAKFHNQIAKLNYIIARAFTLNNQMEDALKFLRISINNYRKGSDTKGILQCYIELHDINILLGNNEKAYQAIIEAREIYIQNKINNIPILISINYKIGESLSRKNQHNQAIKHIKIAFELNLKQGNYHQQATILSLLAEAYYYSKEFEKCEETIKKIKEINIDDALIKQYTYLLSANLYYSQKRYYLAKKNIDHAIAELVILKKNGIEDYNQKIYYHISSLIEYKLGNMKQAYIKSNKYHELEIADLKSDRAKRIEGLQEHFETKEKDVKLKNLLIIKQNKELEILKSNKKNTLFSLIIFILSIGIMLFYLLYRINQKNNHILQTKNDEIERKNSDLLNAREDLKKLLKEKEILLKEIHHRVKNNLQLISSLLNIQSRINKHPIINEFIEKSQNRIISMSLIHQNLYNSENVSKIYFQKYLEDLVEKLIFTFNKENINVSVNSKGVYLDIQIAIPLGLILNEIISNSLKHAYNENEKGEINISFEKKEKIYLLKISDYGKGMIDSVKKKDSIGLELVELLILQINAVFMKINEKGTHYEIKFTTPE